MGKKKGKKGKAEGLTGEPSGTEKKESPGQQPAAGPSSQQTQPVVSAPQVDSSQQHGTGKKKKGPMQQQPPRQQGDGTQQRGFGRGQPQPSQTPRQVGDQPPQRGQRTQPPPQMVQAAPPGLPQQPTQGGWGQPRLPFQQISQPQQPRQPFQQTGQPQQPRQPFHPAGQPRQPFPQVGQSQQPMQGGWGQPQPHFQPVGYPQQLPQGPPHFQQVGYPQQPPQVGWGQPRPPLQPVGSPLPGAEAQPPPGFPQQMPQSPQQRSDQTPSASPQKMPPQRGKQRGPKPQEVPKQTEKLSREPSVEENVSTPTSPQKQQPQRGKQKGQKPQISEQKASTSHEPPTTELSKLQVSKGDVGKGDMQIAPMDFKKYKPGENGRKIIVETNHISLNLGNLKTALHYDVNIVPDTPKKFLREVLECFRQKHYKNRYPAFDGRKNLYSASRLPFGEFIADEVSINIGGTEKKYKVEIKFANYVDLSPLHDFLKSLDTPREALQVVDIVLRSAPAVTCIPVGRSFFVKPPQILDLGEGMEMYNGIYQSAIRGWKPFLNVDVAHKAFPKNINILDILPELLGDYYRPFTREDLSRPLNQTNISTLETFIRTLRVSYEIPGYPSTRRTYGVNGVDNPPKNKVFTLDDGESLTIEKYFEKKKNYRLKYAHLPSIWVGSKTNEKKILLPLELCTIVAGQVLNRKMTENQTSKMIKYAATDTQTRKDKIMRALNTAGHNSHPCVQEFGFSVGNKFERLTARVLQPPQLMYADNRSIQPSRGVWRGERFFRGVTINKWTIISVDRRPPRPDDLSKLADMIFKFGSSSGMTIAASADKPFQSIRCQSVQDIKKYFLSQKEKKYDVIFVIVPNSGPEYSYVKTAAEINVGCLTQCIKSRTLSKMNPQTAVNILLKVNSKLNGTNHFLGTRPPIMNRPCMIMGADVTHPSPDAKNIPSVAAVTASHDPKAFQYNICWRLQDPKVEIIHDLEAIVIEQLKYFYSKNKVKPEKIIFFRDGVSEGQFEEVRNFEIRAIRSACKKLQADGYEPAVTFLVVQKRHHTRLFPTDKRDSEDRNCNVPAGTCVDTTITHPFMQDFYLVSHASIQGVAKPTKYCTLWDDNNMTNDDVEALTYFLCHMFTRCNRSVSYPAPTYYAHLAAARAKVYIENERLDMNQLPREYVRFQIQDAIRKDMPMFFV